MVKFIYQYYFPNDIQISREAEKVDASRVVVGGDVEMHTIPPVGPSRR